MPTRYVIRLTATAQLAHSPGEFFATMTAATSYAVMVLGLGLSDFTIEPV